MGASSSCCFCIAKAEESPCTKNDGVAECEMVEAEGAPTSGRTDYYSARCEAMMRSRGQFTDDVAMEIEFSKSHWSEVRRVEVAPQSAEEEKLNRENQKKILRLMKKRLSPFTCQLDEDLGRMIAKGGQAEIYEIQGRPDRLLKVFERGTALRDLRKSWPLPVFRNYASRCAYFAGLLEDGRFAFLMYRQWGDLRKLIDQAMQAKNVGGVQGPPFPYNAWEGANGWNLRPIDFILGIASRMWGLHLYGISHRDLKASNILLPTNLKMYNWSLVDQLIVIADFECSIGVLGTGYWRAPEILAALGNGSTITNEQWMKADVYSYGMTCFEIVTGRIPFDGELENTKSHHQLVIEGKRPQLPSDLDDAVKDLITQCWAPNPRLRPTFSQVKDMVKKISNEQCWFRLFGIDDELPLRYRLATIEEVDEYTIALAKAMRKKEIANLANGSVGGHRNEYKTRLEKQSDARHKLARLSLDTFS